MQMGRPQPAELIGGAGDEFRRGGPSALEQPDRRKDVTMPTITTSLWFDTQAEEAAEFYVSVFPNSKITNVGRNTEAGPGEPGSVLTVEFVLDGSPFLGLNGGPQFTFSEAISLMIDCADQAEVDYYWDALLAGGGHEDQCGWLKDRFGLSWQVVPRGMIEAVTHPDPERAKRATEAMFGMRKLDVAAVRAAAGLD
jgi:predicted 3-demethylubiquinone-9 3-methyltransferase (glyoxalase superfamily)